MAREVTMHGKKQLPTNKEVRCAFCHSGSMTKITDFGEVALAGAFLKPEQFAQEQFFPMRLCFCDDCYAVQLIDVVDAKVLFENYFYFSSAIRTLQEHFVDYATEVVSRFLEPERSTVVEIGCNDGILLKPMADQQVRTLIGVDPARNVVETINDARITIISDFFGEEIANRIIEEHRKADMIVANNVFAHIPDICGVTKGIRDLLNDEGVFIFEAHYLGKIIHGFQYDMVYHEHLYYYSSLALENHLEQFGMTIFDVKPIPIHAGSMRYYACKKGSRNAGAISPRVALLRNEEIARGFNRAETFAQFAADITERRERLMDLLERLRAKGRRVAGYGASGRANTIIQFCGISHDHIEYMIDDAPAKVGYYTPGSHFQIRAGDVIHEDRPDYLLIFAWGYFNEIAEKHRYFFEKRGRMILPLPDVRVVVQPTRDEDL